MIKTLKLFLYLIFFSDLSLIFAYDVVVNREDCYNFGETGEYNCYKQIQDSYREKKYLAENKKNYIGKYNRKSFKYKSYPTNSNIGFYTKKKM